MRGVNNMSEQKILDEINLIIMELFARDCSNNCLVDSLIDKSWDELCDMGSEMFQKLKSVEK